MQTFQKHMCFCTPVLPLEFDWFSRVNHPVSKYILRREHGFVFNTILLVGGLEHFLFSHILGMSSSQLTNSYFSEA